MGCIGPIPSLKRSFGPIKSLSSTPVFAKVVLTTIYASFLIPVTTTLDGYVSYHNLVFFCTPCHSACIPRLEEIGAAGILPGEGYG